MAFFTWNNGYSVGVEEFDQQHKRLIDMINELYDAMKLGRGNDVMGKLLSDLRSYAAMHLATEEKKMQQINYPDYAQHKDQHLGFMVKVSGFQQKFTQGKENLSIEVMYFLKDWLTKHFQGTDKGTVAKVRIRL